jgi:branched-chain amino acid transport system substrate-binding protein
MSALGYDSVMVLADALKRAGTTEPAKLRDALAATKGFPGVTGTPPSTPSATRPSPPW